MLEAYGTIKTGRTGCEIFSMGDHFITGLSEVDHQHRHLIDVINRLGSLLAEDGIRIQDVDVLFRELSDDAVYHFQEEEQLMSKVKLDARHLNRHAVWKRSPLLWGPHDTATV